MPMIDKATGRVVAVLVLLVVIAACLRGYLPGVVRSSRQEPQHSTASLVYVVALLGVSLLIVAFAVLSRLRDPRRPAASAGPLSDRFGGGVGKPGWRILLIGAGMLGIWLLAVWLVAGLIGPHDVGQPPAGPAPTTSPPTTGTGPPPEPRRSNGNADVLGYLITSTVALMVLTGVAIIAAVRQRRTAMSRSTVAAPPAPSPPAPAPETLARAAEVGLAEIGDLSREPREAIIACYAAMERELAHVPDAAPQDFDTPTEVLARAVAHRALRADNAAQLVKLFTEARFSPHVMTEQHRETAVRVLQLVLAELRSVV